MPKITDEEITIVGNLVAAKRKYIERNVKKIEDLS